MATARGAEWTEARSRGYWKANVRLQVSLLVIWFVVAYVLGILLAEPLNDIEFGGFRLGFWIAQQGSIFTFIGLIFFYAWRTDLIDHQYDVHEADVGVSVRKRFERQSSGKNGGR